MKKKDSNNQQLTFIDLFAGIGGFHLAFHNVGAKCVFVSEWNEPARKTYQTNFQLMDPELFEKGNFVGDITKVDENKMPDFNILTAVFPCQPFSQAGFKKGFKDTRGTLFHDIVRIIKAKQPEAIFLENVRHLLKHDDGKTFEVIRRTIEEDLGYSFYWKVVKASEFNLPQHRPRLFMVGFRDKEVSFQFPEPVPLKKTMTSIFGGDCPKTIGYTLRVGGRGSGIKDRRNWDSYVVDGEVRRLTPKEGKKMMGFPADFKFPVSDGQAMKQLGNAVAIPAIQATADQIIKALKNHYDKRKQGRVERVLHVSEATL